MPEMQTELFDRKVTLELNDDGEIITGYYTDTGAEINTDSVYVTMNRRLQYAIQDFMTEWRAELRDYKAAKGRDRLNE